MKRLFFAVVALSMLATSCAKDDAAAPEATAKTKTVTFSVKAPELKTRAFTAPGNGANATTLYYAFYDEEGLVAGISQTGGVTFDGEEEISATLIDGKTYTAIFWAQNASSGYTVTMPKVLAEACVSMNYEAAEVGNSENYDAFWAVVPEIEGIDTNVELKRPFAQVNIGVPASDIEDANKAGVIVKAVKVNVTGLPTSFNLSTGAVGNTTSGATFDWVVPGGWKVTLNEVEYTILATNYVLVGNVTDKKLGSVDFYMSEAPVTADEGEVTTAATATNNITREFGNAVPVQANYRTFIVGDIITGGADNVKTWTVKIAPDFEDGDDEGTDPDDKIVNADAL